MSDQDSAGAGKLQSPGKDVDVPDGANEEIPPEELSHKGKGIEDSGAMERVEDPEGKHRRDLEKLRLNYAMLILAVSALMVMLLIVADALLWETAERREINLANIADFFKLTGTTALGFILGKHLNSDK